MFLVYRTYYDSDFDSQASLYFCGLYKTEDEAKAYCEKEFGKPRYIEVPVGKEKFIKLI